MERGTRKQVLIQRIAFLENELKERNIKIRSLQERLSALEINAKSAKGSDAKGK